MINKTNSIQKILFKKIKFAGDLGLFYVLQVRVNSEFSNIHSEPIPVLFTDLIEYKIY